MFRAVIFSLLLVATPALSQSANERNAAQLVDNMVHEVLRAAVGRTERQRAGNMLPVVNRYIDAEGVAEAALGPNIWPSLSLAERAEFVRVYPQMIALQYAMAFDGRGGERVRVGDTLELAGGRVRVSSVITAAGSETEVGFIVGGRNGRKVLNILLGGVSMLDQDRAVFEATWEAAGKQYRPFVDALLEAP